MGIASRSSNILTIWHVQDHISTRYFGLLTKLFGILGIMIPEKIIVDGIKILDGMPEKMIQKSEVVINGVNLDEIKPVKSAIQIRESLGIHEDVYIIGHMARFTPWKGQHLLLEAFVAYSREKPHAVLLMIGAPMFNNDKYFKFIKNQIKLLKLSDRVILTGYRSDVGDLLSIIDLFVYPSVEKDTSPLALISAMVSGCPTAVSDIESLHDTYLGCDLVEVFENRSISGILNIIKKYESAVLRESVGKSIKQWAVLKFDIGLHTQKMTNIIEGICA